MHLVILPGNSKQYNEQWLTAVADHFKDLFDSVTPHVYEHWKTGTGEEHGDTKLEAEKLAREVAELSDDYVIYAKSLGAITTIRAHAESTIAPKKCIFVGSPFEGADEELIGWISKFKISSLFIQQTNDMFFKFAELENFLEKNWTGAYSLIEIPGENHAYDYHEEIREMMVEFLEL